MVEDWRLSLDKREAVAVLAIDLRVRRLTLYVMAYCLQTKSLWLYRSSIGVDEQLLAR